jgi:hypothetical protein
MAEVCAGIRQTHREIVSQVFLLAFGRPRAVELTGRVHTARFLGKN